MKITRILLAAIVIVIVIAGVFVAVQYSKPSAMTTTTQASMIPGTLVIDDGSFPGEGLNILYALQYMPYPDWMEVTQYQTLINMNATAEFQEGKIQYLPDLATKWTVSPDGTTYTFTLRDGVKFSNGNPFNSYVVWFEMYSWYFLAGNSTGFLSGLNLFDGSAINFGPATYNLINQSGLANPSSQVLEIWRTRIGPYTHKDLAPSSSE